MSEDVLLLVAVVSLLVLTTASVVGSGLAFEVSLVADARGGLEVGLPAVAAGLPSVLLVGAR